MVIEAFDRVHLDGTGIDRITEDEVVAVVRDALSRGRGGRIITEAESSCVVYGMPRAVDDAALSDRSAPLDQMANAIMEFL